jgi:hypothetical protein
MRRLARIAASLLDESRRKKKTSSFGAVPVLPMAASMLAKIRPVSQWRNKRRLRLNCINVCRVERGYLAAQVRKKGRFGGGVVVFQSANKHTLTLRVNQITTLTNMVVTMSDEHNEKKTGDSVVLSVVDSILNVEENNADNFGDNADSVDVLNEKMIDAMTPGAMVEFDPDEAERIGAFQEDALDESDALESSIDLEDIG